MMQARSELAPMVKTAAPSSTVIAHSVETGSSPWIFAWASVSFAVVLGCVIYLSTISF